MIASSQNGKIMANLAGQVRRQLLKEAAKWHVVILDELQRSTTQVDESICLFVIAGCGLLSQQSVSLTYLIDSRWSKAEMNPNFSLSTWKFTTKLII